MDREKHSHIMVNQYILILIQRKLINQIIPKISTYVTKAKAIPLQTWTGPEGSRWLRIPDFKTVGI